MGPGRGRAGRKSAAQRRTGNPCLPLAAAAAATLLRVRHGTHAAAHQWGPPHAELSKGGTNRHRGGETRREQRSPRRVSREKAEKRKEKKRKVQAGNARLTAATRGLR